MVFCINCKYFIRRDTNCDNPKNITTKNSWERAWKSYIREPRTINKKNNCKWFELMLG